MYLNALLCKCFESGLGWMLGLGKVLVTRLTLFACGWWANSYHRCWWRRLVVM